MRRSKVFFIHFYFFCLFLPLALSNFIHFTVFDFNRMSIFLIFHWCASLSRFIHRPVIIFPYDGSLFIHSCDSFVDFGWWKIYIVHLMVNPLSIRSHIPYRSGYLWSFARAFNSGSSTQKKRTRRVHAKHNKRFHMLAFLLVEAFYCSQFSIRSALLPDARVDEPGNGNNKLRTVQHWRFSQTIKVRMIVVASARRVWTMWWYRLYRIMNGVARMLTISPWESNME